MDAKDTRLYQPRIDLGDLQEGVERIVDQIRKVIVGQNQMIELMIAAILSEGHVLIEGVPGVAKTLACKLTARTLAIDFSRIQFTPDLMPSDVIGTPVLSPERTTFVFRKGPVFSNLVLIDEINRAPAKTQSALFEVMEERQITMDGTTYPMTEPFMVVATQNPIEYEGTYRLPEAQLDRFLFKIQVTYPSIDEEVSILDQHHERGHTSGVDQLEPVLSAREIREHRSRVARIHVDGQLRSYIAQIVERTRHSKSLDLGGSPRASIALMRCSKAIAAMRGRDFVTPEDIQYVARPVLRHRIMLTAEREMEGVTTDKVIGHILEHVDVPR